MNGPTSTAAVELEPTALAMRAIGPWLRAGTCELDPDLAGKVLSRMELAVHEACMNVVDHARLADGETIALTLVLGPRDLTVRIRDRGTHFDPVDVPRPPSGQLQERGYGVTIVRALVDDLRYHHDGSANELRLRIHLEAPRDGR